MTEDEEVAWEICVQERDAILTIARELAAKHMRGGQCCTCCAAPPYMGNWSHADGCAVKRLDEEFR